MKSIIFTICLASLLTLQAECQKYLTKTGLISFYSDAPVEKIQATNRQVNAVLDAATGDFAFRVLMRSFVFEKALMQEHFNENYVESDKYPNAMFIGKITNLKEINFSKDGVYPAVVEGKLTIHNQTKDINVKGTLEIANGSVHAKAKFNVLVADYNITIPNVVINNISKTIEITVDCILEPLSKQ